MVDPCMCLAIMKYLKSRDGLLDPKGALFTVISKRAINSANRKFDLRAAARKT